MLCGRIQVSSFHNWWECSITLDTDKLELKVIYFSKVLGSSRNQNLSGKTEELGQAKKAQCLRSRALRADVQSAWKSGHLQFG